MKTISISVSAVDYEVFREAAQKEGRPIAQLIREAMSFYRQERLEQRKRLANLPVLAGHRSRGSLPDRHELYDEIFERDS